MSISKVKQILSWYMTPPYVGRQVKEARGVSHPLLVGVVIKAQEILTPLQAV